MDADEDKTWLLHDLENSNWLFHISSKIVVEKDSIELIISS